MTLIHTRLLQTAILGLLFSLVVTAQAEHGEITTIVGNATQGYCGDEGPAIEACLYWPSSLAIDAAGNLFIGDYFNHCVRKVHATNDVVTGDDVISTVAGICGESGYDGDGGLALNAHLHGTHSVAVDPAGNIFTNDVFNCRYRHVDASTGIITTIIGTGTCGFNGDGHPGTETQIHYAGGGVLDTEGNMYFIDQENDRVRRWDATPPHLVTTVAGNGTRGFCGDGGPAISACLDRPHGIAFDSMGNLCIADLYNYRVRCVDAVTGVITTFAGIGALWNTGDCGLAIDAGIGGPVDIEFDALDNMFITSVPSPIYPNLTPNHVIRRVDANSGIIVTVAGTGVPGYNGDGIPATVAQLNWPMGTAVDAGGNLLIADQENNRVRSVEGIATNVDIDSDGAIDYCDNCVSTPNADQRDSNGEGIGNACDADLNDDCDVNFGDLAMLKDAFTPRPYNPDADFDGDGNVNFGDLAFMKSSFFSGENPGPGPSGIPNDCDGS